MKRTTKQSSRSKNFVTYAVRRDLSDMIIKFKDYDDLPTNSAALHKVVSTGLKALNAFSPISSRAS